MTTPIPSSTPTGLDIPYMGISSPNPGNNWYRRRDPTVRDFAIYQVLDRWKNQLSNEVFILLSKANGSATWVLLTDENGPVLELDGDTGSAVATDGVITIAGTALEIETAASGSTVTIGIPSTFSIGSAAGANSATILSGTGGITLTATNGAITVNSGTAAINIGTAATAQSINVGTGAGLKVLILGSSNTTSSTDLVSGTGGINIDSNDGILAINSGGGTIGFSTDNVATDIEIGTGNGDKDLIIGSTNALSSLLLQSGTAGITCSGSFHLTSVATFISMNGGAATDFIGSGTLTNGVATIANTNIAAGDQIFFSRTAVNASTATGNFTYVITPATNFVVTSTEPATPGDTEVNDQSSFGYIIFRQT